jgi:hypothetical protein
MIQIARLILSAIPAKIGKDVRMAGSAIFDEENPRDTILGGIILVTKFG